jgi:hypothetical protein
LDLASSTFPDKGSGALSGVNLCQLIPYLKLISNFCRDVLVKSPSQAATDNRYSVYFDFFYDTHEDEGTVFFNGFRLYSYQLPVRRLFRGDVPAAEAYRKFAMYLQKHMVAPGIPNSDELKRFNLSRYYSASAYEASLTHQLSTFAVNEETLSAVEL